MRANRDTRRAHARRHGASPHRRRQRPAPHPLGLPLDEHGTAMPDPHLGPLADELRRVLR